VSTDSILIPVHAQEGHVLVLTKPLGTQVAVNCQQWTHQLEKLESVLQKCAKGVDLTQLSFQRQPLGFISACSAKNTETSDDAEKIEYWSQKPIISLNREILSETFDRACAQMMQLNLTASELMMLPSNKETSTTCSDLDSKSMHKLHFETGAATDITGFGILGHVDQLCSLQQEPNLHFEIHTLPILKGMVSVSVNHFSYRLLEGLSAETSGGLLMSMPEHKAVEYCHQFDLLQPSSNEGFPSAWIIGKVTRGFHTAARFAKRVEIIEV